MVPSQMENRILNQMCRQNEITAISEWTRFHRLWVEYLRKIPAPLLSNWVTLCMCFRTLSPLMGVARFTLKEIICEAPETFSKWKLLAS